MISELEKEYGKYKDIIADSRFEKQIRFLAENPHLAFAQLHDGKGIKPCCWGTAVYLLGGNKKVKDLWEKAGHKFDDFSDAMGDFVCIPDDNIPGYVGEEPMKMFQEILSRIGRAPDTLVSLYWDIPNTEACGFRLRHSGICLGKDDGQDIMFHQLNEGERFCICPVEEFERTLSSYARKSLEKRFYAPLGDAF